MIWFVRFFYKLQIWAHGSEERWEQLILNARARSMSTLASKIFLYCSLKNWTLDEAPLKLLGQSEYFSTFRVKKKKNKEHTHILILGSFVSSSDINNLLFNKWLHTHYYILRTGKRTCVSGMLLCEIQLIIAKKCGIFVDYTGKNKTGMQKKQRIDHKHLNSNTTADEFCLLQSKEMNKHHAPPCRWKNANILLFMLFLYFLLLPSSVWRPMAKEMWDILFIPTLDWFSKTSPGFPPIVVWQWSANSHPSRINQTCRSLGLLALHGRGGGCRECRCYSPHKLTAATNLYYARRRALRAFQMY